MATFAAPLVLVAGFGAALASGALCERAGAAAETEYGLPSGLLLAVGRVESGRHDPLLGRVAPWPWAVNVAGAGHLSPSRPLAVNAVRQARRDGHRNIDAGCFQVNLLHHPNAFPSIEDAFDPVLNARYAARLLADARQRLGSWTAAVESYHSANPARGIPYGRAVMGRWTDNVTDTGPREPVSAHGMKDTKFVRERAVGDHHRAHRIGSPIGRCRSDRRSLNRHRTFL
jgi:hypothetical protein